MRDGPYSAHEMLVGPARGRPELWRLLAGLVLGSAIAMALGVVLNNLLATLAPRLIDRPKPGDTPGSLLVLLYGYALVTASIFIAARILQNRRAASLIGPLPLALGHFWRVLRILVLLIAALAILPPYDMGDELVPNLDPGTWFVLLPLSLGAVLIQSSSEEILFRGYIQQSLAARFQNPLIWMVVPSILFGLGHFVPADAGENAWLVALWAFVFGLMMSDLTARAGTLGPAIALHMVNNTTALLLVSVPDSLSGLSLATTPYAMSDAEQMRSWLLIDFVFMTVTWLAARLAIRR